MPESRNIRVGIIRPDIRMIRREPLMLFDPQADAYYRISERAGRIISQMTTVMVLSDFLAKLEKDGENAL